LSLGEDIRIERVLTNLLDNAVSFSPPDGVVEISATRSDDEVIIRISDQGPGIPPNERETVFRRFHSARPESEGFGKHSGLGLAIARTIIEGHHGSISVDDRDDGLQGACFRISLPRAAAGRTGAMRNSETLIHATAVAINGQAILLMGASGSGKSDLAIRLIDRGAVLVSDDYCDIVEGADGPEVHAKSGISGKIEVRGVGICECDHIPSAPLAMALKTR
jgi:hypothetical protein